MSSTWESTSSLWSKSNIWGNGGLSNGMLQGSARGNMGSRDLSQQPISPTTEEHEPKRGSGSLVDGSFSLESYGIRPTYGQKRNMSTGKALLETHHMNGSAGQQRSFSTAGQTLGQASAGLEYPYGIAPPPINLNIGSAAQQHSIYGQPYMNGRSKSNNDPPQVFTKLNRPEEPSKVDSANPHRPNASATSFGSFRDPSISPIEERRPRVGLDHRMDSKPVSRDASNGAKDERTGSRPSDYSGLPNGIVPANSRIPSIASTANGGYGGFGYSGDDELSRQIDQLSLQSNSRPSTSYKSTSSFNGAFDQYTAPATSSYNRSFSHRGIFGMDGNDDIEDVPRLSMPQHRSNGYNTSSTPIELPTFGQTGLGSSMHHLSNSLNPRNASVFTPNGTPSNGSGSGENQRPTPGLHGYTNGDLSLNARLAANGPLHMDPRMQQMLIDQIRTGYSPYFSPYGMANGLQLPTYLPMQIQMNGTDPYANPSDLPPGEGVQSALMYEFKSNIKSRRFTLKDIFGHVAEFAGDQHGSRFIQTNLETANSDDKERVFREIEPNVLQLMTDVFGNYVIQKFFEHGDQTHKKILANNMRGRVLELSLQMYGCRVVQKAIDHVLVDQQASLINELKDHVTLCVKDQNGNHVIQKAIERCPSHTIGFIFEAFRGQVASLSIHSYGCRVIQRCLERGDSPSKAMILKELLEPQGIPTMISDQYGNYVIQHVVVKDNGPCRMRVFEHILGGLEGFSKHKFASNVVEKCLEQANDMWRRMVVHKLVELNNVRRMEGGEDVFVGLIKDNFGNYVIQKLLDTLSSDDFASFVEILQPAMSQAKRTGCGKQVQSIEKKMERFARLPRWNTGYSNHTHGQHNGHNHDHYGTMHLSLPPPLFASTFASAANTPPPLTADTQSLQSSGLPSINGDAVEGAVAERMRKGSGQEHDGRFGQ
ncbi:mRNA binding protein puf3 [Recurvomyces mirabilis]|uniref:mRNA binding protein puf3 n=1 Tax=Recurvomyces mirabilis TaxID=574656 RepID=A0AAE0WJG8_9PEZI|nr:mRNA binding protein puf3 [Recurvomyces mirabilis]KAK5155559.1 mRNA binding protein puf3 [Recurvomyces mirabilis]